MVYERRRWNDRYRESELSQRYTGKVQYLRQEHGYIRSKTKINGIRDVTFNFSDVHPSSVNLLEVGAIVSFRVNIYSSGKFCAIDIRKEESCDLSSNSGRSGSPLSTLSSERCNDSLDNETGRFTQESDSDISSCYSSKPYHFEYLQEPFIIPSYEKVSEGKLDCFSQNVDSFLERVISRNYDASSTTCWLTF